MDFLLYFILLTVGAIVGFVFALHQIGKTAYLIEAQAWQRGFNHAIEIINTNREEKKKACFHVWYHAHYDAPAVCTKCGAKEETVKRYEI